LLFTCRGHHHGCPRWRLCANRRPITLGLGGRENLPARLGRNAAFDRAGNVFIAAFIGVVGVAYSQKTPFYLAPLFAALTAIAVLSIPARAIDHDKVGASKWTGPATQGFPAAGVF
jgi:hypothetical protein